MYSFRYIFFALSLFFSTLTYAATTYNPATNILTIDSVIDNGVQYNNVVMNLGSGFSVVSVGSSTPVTGTSTGTVSATCSSSNFSTAIFNAIAVGMTMSQVNQTIGCQYNSGYTQRAATYTYNVWVGPSYQMINVWFDASDSVVTGLGTTFKGSSGF